MSGALLEPASNWILVSVPTFPDTIRTTDGQAEVSKSIVIDEIKRVSSKFPGLHKLCCAKNPEVKNRA